MATKQFSIRLDETLKADLERLAQEDERKLSEYIARVLAAHVRDKLPTTARQAQRQTH